MSLPGQRRRYQTRNSPVPLDYLFAPRFSLWLSILTLPRPCEKLQCLSFSLRPWQGCMMKQAAKRWWTRIGLVVFAGLILANSGCLLVAAGAAGGAAVGYAYYKGKIDETYAAAFNDS